MGGRGGLRRVAAATLVLLPEALSFETGAAISCGTGTAYGALRRMNLSGRDTLAVVGQGPVGLSATQLAAAMGARVIAIDMSPERLARPPEFRPGAPMRPGHVLAGVKEPTAWRPAPPSP